MMPYRLVFLHPVTPTLIANFIIIFTAPLIVLFILSSLINNKGVIIHLFLFITWKNYFMQPPYAKNSMFSTTYPDNLILRQNIDLLMQVVAPII